MKTKLTATVGTALVLAVCATGWAQTNAPPDDEAIREAVFLQLLSRADTNRVLFLSCADAEWKYSDPSEALLDRIRKHGWPVHKGSESSEAEHGKVIDKKTGKSGVIYFTGNVRRLNESDVEVRAGSYSASLAGGWFEAIMRQVNGKWILQTINKTVMW